MVIGRNPLAIIGRHLVASAEIYEAMEERGVKYAIRLPANDNLLRVLFFHKRPCGPLANNLFTTGPTPTRTPQSHWKPLITRPMTPSKELSIS